MVGFVVDRFVFVVVDVVVGRVGEVGALVFEGMAQFASDLIILGSAPIVAIAILTDLGLRALELRFARPLS